MEYVKCNKCNNIKSIDCFVKDKGKQNGYRNICKQCNNLRLRKTPLKPKSRDQYKICSCWNKEKPLNEFNTRLVNKKYTQFSYCKTCEHEKNKNRYIHICKICNKKYKSGRKDSLHCKLCYNKYILKTQSILHTMDWSGENNPMFGVKRYGKENPNYNPNKTDEERNNSRLIEGYKLWVQNVYKRDNYTCQCCGDNDIIKKLEEDNIERKDLELFLEKIIIHQNKTMKIKLKDNIEQLLANTQNHNVDESRWISQHYVPLENIIYIINWLNNIKIQTKAS